jgi:hypothetical protein
VLRLISETSEWPSTRNFPRFILHHIVARGPQMRTLLVLSFLLCSTAAYAIDERDTARHFIPLCKAASSDEPPQSWEAGMCLGVVRTLLYVKNFLDSKYAYCTPPDGSTLKAMQLITSSLEANSKMLDEDFVLAAMVILHDKWPCK